MVKRLLPWIGSVLLIGYLAYTTDLDTVAEAFLGTDLALVLLVALVGTLVTFFTDTLCVWMAFRRFVTPVTFRETLPIKATSYFLNILNYNAALAGMALYLKRLRGVGFWQGLGSLLFLNVVDLVALLILLLAGLVVNTGQEAVSPELESLLWLLSGGGLVGFVVGLLLFRSDLPIPLMAGLRKRGLFRPIAVATAGDWLRFIALRIVFLCQYLAAQYLLLWLFGVQVPILLMLVYLPLLTFIQIVPISISGLGTTQIAMRSFYSRFVTRAGGTPGAVVDAASTTAIFGFLIFRIFLAYFFLGELSRDIIRDAAAAARESEPTAEDADNRLASP